MSDITIRDIAKRCGVGVSTVSRAINNHPDINPQTREKILEVIHETGFIPNDSARYLKRTESNAVILLVKGIGNPLFTDMIRIMEEEIELHGYSVILRHVEGNEDEASVALSIVKEKKPKGIVFLGGNFTHGEGILEQIGVPCIFATIGEDPRIKETRKEAGDEKKNSYANIAVDDVQAGYDAVDYLIRQGHSHIGMVTEGLDIPSVGHLRYLGCRKAMQDHGLSMKDEDLFIVTEGSDHYSLENGYKAAKTLLQNDEEITAIFCISDVLAMGVCRAIIDLGKKVPKDISVIGFDGIEMGDYMSPRLTTMRQPFEEIALESIRMLFGMIEKKKTPCDRILGAQLLVRESTAARPCTN